MQELQLTMVSWAGINHDWVVTQTWSQSRCFLATFMHLCCPRNFRAWSLKTRWKKSVFTEQKFILMLMWEVMLCPLCLRVRPGRGSGVWKSGALIPAPAGGDPWGDPSMSVLHPHLLVSTSSLISVLQDPALPAQTTVLSAVEWTLVFQRFYGFPVRVYYGWGWNADIRKRLVAFGNAQELALPPKSTWKVLAHGHWCINSNFHSQNLSFQSKFHLK